MSWDSDRIVYRDIYARRFALLVGGKDVTMFRGVPSQIGGYQLQQPYGYGPADFAFPQITHFEELGTGDLWWLDQEKPVRLVPIVNGERGEDVWRGFVSITRTSDGHVQIHCDGEASGRLINDIKPPSLFTFDKDIGLLAFEAMREVGLPFTPRLGPTTGIIAENRGNGGTYLEYINDLLSNLTAGGGQYSIDPVWMGGRHVYKMRVKDITTVDATVMCGTPGVSEDLSDDLSEKPKTFYGTGIDPNGQKWMNVKAPNVLQGDTPDYPGPLTLGSTGEAVTVAQVKLVGTGYLSREDTGDATYDEETAEAVAEVQANAGLPETGDVDRATWDALFDLSDTGLSLRQSGVLPLAQHQTVKQWYRTSNGSIARRNPNFDPAAINVARMVDHGPGVRKRRARNWSKRALQRAQQGDNYVGTLSFDGADLFVGDVNHNTPDKQLMSRLDLRPGMNVRFRNYQGGNPVLHISGVNVDADLNVRIAVDTKGRDLLSLGQIIERNRQSRSNPAREWLQGLRGRPSSFDSTVIWSEIGGILDVPVHCPANEWTVFRVVAGQEGDIARLRIRTDDDKAAYCMAVFGYQTLKSGLQAHIPDPWTVDEDGETAWSNPDVQEWLKERVMLYAAGDAEQPCGYWPRRHTGPNGNVTAHPITGVWEDDASFPYRTFKNPVLYVAIHPDRDTTVQPGRIMWPQHTEGS